jgi:hypothetical protein
MDLVSPSNGDNVHFGEGAIMFLHEDMVLLEKWPDGGFDGMEMLNGSDFEP